MSVYTLIERTELEALLRDYDLGELIAFEGIGDGIDNSNYFVDTTKGRQVFTIFERLSASELPFFLDWMQHLHACGVPGAQPLLRRDGQMLSHACHKPAAFFSFISGRCLMSPNPIQCKQVGESLAKMHLASRSFLQKRANNLGVDWLKATVPALLNKVSTEEATLLVRAQKFLDKISWKKLPQGIIHADLFKDNIMFQGEKIAGMIDFYDACTDSLAYDLAIAFNAWCFDSEQNFLPAQAESLVSSYKVVRPFESAEDANWPALLVAAALRWWVGRILGWQAPKEGALTQEKDPKEMQLILAFHLGNL